MRVFLDKLFLLAGCFLFLLYNYPQVEIPHVLALLSAIIFVCLCTYNNPDALPLITLRKPVLFMEAALFIIFLLAGCTQPYFAFFLPLLFYELIEEYNWYLMIPALAGAFVASRSQRAGFLLLYLMLFLLTYFIRKKSLGLIRLEGDFKLLRDTSTEYNLLLHQKNQELLKQQDYEIHVATLKERNRIAREIHDNVGHMLSRSILQSGALITLNKDLQLKEPLNSLKDTLSLAMDSIRESVHDLHDESVDLESSLYILLQDFKDYDVYVEYDMGPVLPKNVNYCFIAIMKEALSNISKHSNATRIHITAREHPSLYQFTIEDNGLDISIQNTGIGLENMKERVDILHGNFTISTEHGFRIFVSIPKTE